MNTSYFGTVSFCASAKLLRSMIVMTAGTLTNNADETCRLLPSVIKSSERDRRRSGRSGKLGSNCVEMGPFLFGDRKNSNSLKLKVQKELHTAPEKCATASARPGGLAKGAGTRQLWGTDL